MKRSTLLMVLLFVPAVAAAEGETHWVMDRSSRTRKTCRRCSRRGAVRELLHRMPYAKVPTNVPRRSRLPHDMFLANLVFNDQKIGSLITNALPREASKAWFGAAPPDLTLVAKLRGADWVYNYLKAFYVDPARPFGVNNKVFPNVAMPHALLELQGIPVEACHQVPKRAENGGEMRDPLVPGLAITEKQCGFIDVVEGSGRLTPKQFDEAVYDIANFLYYVAEPARMERERLGVYVLLFLVVLYVFTLLLGREYNKETR
jgi:cytochrome c1